MPKPMPIGEAPGARQLTELTTEFVSQSSVPNELLWIRLTYASSIVRLNLQDEALAPQSARFDAAHVVSSFYRLGTA